LERASSADREYLARIARQNLAIEDEAPPASLAEMLDRLETIRRLHGALARPGVRGSDDGDLPGHLAFLERIRTTARRGAKRS
jgi:hypothetical protein